MRRIPLLLLLRKLAYFCPVKDLNSVAMMVIFDKVLRLTAILIKVLQSNDIDLEECFSK